MKKTILLLVLNIVIGGICQAQLPERNAVNIENTERFVRNIYIRR